MIGLCNIPPGSPLFGVDVHSARPHFDWDNMPSSSICERFGQRNNAKSTRKMLNYLRDGRKVWEGTVTEPQSSNFCWTQTFFRSRLIVHTREMLLDSMRREKQQPQSAPAPFWDPSKRKPSNGSIVKRMTLGKRKEGRQNVSPTNAPYQRVSTTHFDILRLGKNDEGTMN